MAFAADMRDEWRRFKHDPPGERFEKHRQRMERHPRWHQMVRATAGGLLVAIGVVLLFLPGPGLLGIIFGFALLAGMSRGIARMMDRVEPRTRAGLHRAHEGWRRLPQSRRALLVGTAAIVVAMGVDVVWRNWLGPAFG
jgi:hypothetical protein